MSITAANPKNAILSHWQIDEILQANPIEWLAIAPDDPQLLESLSEVLADKSAVILKISDQSGGFLESAIQHAVGRALRQCDINHIVLVGMTPADPGPPEDTADPTPPSDAGGLSIRLQQGSGIQRTANRVAQERLACQVDQFVGSTMIHQRWNDRSLGVCGLLYRSRDAVFLLYDADEKSFTKLESAV